MAMRVVVVGANGQLGFRACAELARRGHDVRGTVRQADRGSGLADLGVDVAVADPGAAAGLREALAGTEVVLLTANAAAPRAGDDLAATQRWLERVVPEAEAAGARRFCVVSAPRTPVARSVPFERGKERIEELLRASAMEDVVLRFPPFMEVWLALVGSSLPARGEERATVDRPSPFMRRFRRLTGRMVEDHGVMLVPGSPRNRNAFISITDVARACAEAIERGDVAGQEIEVGGPEVLTWAEVAEVFGTVLHRRVTTVSTPAPVYGLMAKVLGPLAPVPSATMGLNQTVAVMQTPWSPGGGGLLDPDSMVTLRRFLRDKAGQAA